MSCSSSGMHEQRRSVDGEALRGVEPHFALVLRPVNTAQLPHLIGRVCVCMCVCVCVCDGVVQCVGVSDSSPSPCVAALRAVRSVRHPRHTAHTQPTSAQVNRRPVCCYDVIAALGQSCRQLDDSPNTNTHTHNRLTVLCPGLPGRAGTRRIIHPLAPILFIRHQAGMSPLPGGR